MSILKEKVARMGKKKLETRTVVDKVYTLKHRSVSLKTQKVYSI